MCYNVVRHYTARMGIGCQDSQRQIDCLYADLFLAVVIGRMLVSDRGGSFE